MNSKLITNEERRKEGKALRENCPRSSHAEWKPRPRQQDIIKLLEESNADRIPGLIAIRYGRMAQTPFTFFRGSAIIQARDLMKSPVSGITLQACGDCHLMNFGGFATPERNLVFDINDFDETFPGPFEWDLKRLAVSIVLCARDRDFSKKDAEEAVGAAVQSYRTRMSNYADMKLLEVWYSKITLDDLMYAFEEHKDVVKRIKRKKEEAQSRTSESLFPKLTAAGNGRRKILDNPPFIYHFKQNVSEFEKLRDKFIKHYANTLQSDRRLLYDNFIPEDIVVKVVGIGSVGTRCIVELLMAGEDDPLFLQVKEARRSVLEPPGIKSLYKNQGQRVVEGQRLLQATSDIFLGWSKVPNGHDYYVRQLRDMKVSAEPETFRPETLRDYSTMCGWALARAHAKAGNEKMITGYLGSSDKFDDALVTYAVSYADQVERDFEVFKKAISSGRLHTDIDESSELSFLL
jgi:uncharacterized protein (DUF2252 family)